MFLWAAAGLCQAGAIGIFHTEESSRRELFPSFQSTSADTFRFTDSLRARARELLKSPFPETQIVFERILFKDGATGYIYRASEIGKVEYMDFAVALDAGGRVTRVLLTAYRESIGGEVKSKRFMRQFGGKACGHPLRLNRDIDGISGATLSARAVTLGVRKAVCFWKAAYGKT